MNDAKPSTLSGAPISWQREQRTFCEDLAQRLVEAARRAGADEADATCGVNAGTSARARDGAIEELSASRSRAAGLRVIVDGRLGFTTSADAPIKDDEVDEFAKTAVELARISSPSDDNVLLETTAPEPQALEAELTRLKLWDPKVFDLPSSWTTETALELEKRIVADPAIRTVRDSSCGYGYSVFALSTSNGFVGSTGGTSAHFSGSGVADDGDKNQVAGWWTVGRRLTDLESVDDVVKTIIERTKRKVGAKKIDTCRAPVIFEPPMARTLVGALLGAMNGEAIARGATFLADKIGERVLPAGMSLVDDPTVPYGLASRAFDGEAQAVRRQVLVDDDGRLQQYLLDGRSAHRLGLTPSGHAGRGASSMPSPSSSNVILTPGDIDQAELIKRTERGLLVTNLLGHSPDPVTGEYSRGAAGLWIENGEIAFPVEEVTIAGDMVDIMTSIDLVANDVDKRSSLLVPTFRVAEMQISGS